MQFPFLLSSFLHIIVLLFMFFGLDISYKKTIVDDNTMIVDFTQLGPKTAAPIKLDVPEVEKKQKQTPQKKITEPVEQKEKTDTAAKENDHKKNKEKVDKPTEKTPKPSEEKEGVNLNKKKPTKKPEKKQEIQKKKSASKQRAQVNFDAKHEKNQKGKKVNLDDMLDDLIDDKAKDAKSSKAGAPDTAETFTASEISILRTHISRCWNVHSGAMGAKHHIVDVEIHLSKNGFVQSTRVLDQARMKNDPYYRVSAETAQRSLLDDECNPLPIPSSSYEKWKVITFRFDPKDMF